MAYHCDLGAGQHLYLDQSPIHAPTDTVQTTQTIVLLAGQTPGQQQQSSSSFPTGSWTAPPTVVKTAHGVLITVFTANGEFYIQVQGNAIASMQTSGVQTPDLKQGQSMQLQSVAHMPKGATLPPIAPMAPMQPMSPMSPMAPMSPMTPLRPQSPNDSSNVGPTPTGSGPLPPLSMGNMSMSMNPMEMRMGNMEMRMGTISGTAATTTEATTETHTEASIDYSHTEPRTETTASTPVSPSSSPVRNFCPQCGTKVAPDDRFCSHCGHSLR